MDRLIIESILADVNEVFLSEDNAKEELNPSVVLGFKALHNEQIIHAFSALKQLSQGHKVSLQICKTLVSGMYDLEITTDALDEPIRICNKVMTPEFLSGVEERIAKGIVPVLGTNVSEEENWIRLSSIEIKDCSLDQQQA